MIRHYLKVAFRNLWKYKNQTLVSVIGLATGFACFAMATLWIRYEMTYDSFHKKADRIYCIYTLNPDLPNGINMFLSTPFAGYLKSTFPEIANATAIGLGGVWNFKYEGISHKADIISVDSSFFSMFDVKIVEGNMEFPIYVHTGPEGHYESSGIKKAAITREKALQIFGNENPVGKKIEQEYGDPIEICAVVTGLPDKQSNFPFDFLAAFEQMNWYNSAYTYVELVPGIDMEAFEKKLYEHENPIPQAEYIKNMKLVPITSVRYINPYIVRDIKLQHTVIFAIAGLLLILCTLFNYLTLFVSRFRIRQRELALRTVYGASVRSLFAMLSIEFLVSLVASLLFGLILINILNPSFSRVSGIRLGLSAIYLESITYIAGIIVIALTVFFLTLVIFRFRTLDASIRSNKKIFRKTSIVVQLTVSIVFAFCTLVILKQMYHLHNSANLGFSFKNRGSVVAGIPPEQINVLNDKMEQIPEIKETMTGHYPLLPIHSHARTSVHDWDGKQENTTKDMMIDFAGISEQYVKFYELELIEGEFLRDDDDDKYVLIDESAAKAFGWHKATGKSFNRDYVVKGVIKNIYKFSPTSVHAPFLYKHNDRNDRNDHQARYISFKYEEGSWKTCMEKIIEKEFPNKYYSFFNMKEEYNKYLKSENALLAILSVVSLVCLIVCVFGFVSMVSLTCEERRKEIAIRKINGATIKDILDIFFKEYLTLLAIGALIAFPVGYIIMKPWVEQYVIQTPISAWIYLSILLALIMVIVICVGGRVYKTSRENPINALNR
jgi:hypothetical protein